MTNNPLTFGGFLPENGFGLPQKSRPFKNDHKDFQGTDKILQEVTL
jgi:hypothetical protein